MEHAARRDLTEFDAWRVGHAVGWFINMHRADTTACIDHALRFARERNFGALRTNRLVDSVLHHYGKD